MRPLYFGAADFACICSLTLAVSRGRDTIYTNKVREVGEDSRVGSWDGSGGVRQQTAAL